MLQESSDRSIEHMPRLDGLRAIAILGVLVEHFSPSAALRSASPGGAGVTLFFVVSGYLITRILIQYRDQGWSISWSVTHFYWRRLLRLGPPFYLSILAAAILDISLMREHWWIHSLYLSNFLIGMSDHLPGGADHFWSLSTEEQFYLIWFFVVVVLPRKYLCNAMVVSLLITLAFRSIVYFAGWNSLTTMLLPGNLASLVVGALLAQSEAESRWRSVALAALDHRALALSGLVFFAVSLSLPFFVFPRVVIYPFAGAAFFVCLLIRARRTERDPALDWLANPILRHIGKISYGIYLYHYFLPSITWRFPVVDVIVERHDWASFFVLSCGTILAAQLSWSFVEKPILAYKSVVRSPRASTTRGFYKGFPGCQAKIDHDEKRGDSSFSEL